MQERILAFKKKGFCVGLYSSNYKYIGEQTFVMSHNQTYEIYLRNDHPRYVVAEVLIDGKNIGKYLLKPYQELFLERPPDHQQRFTFYHTHLLPKYQECQDCCVKMGNQFNGLIEIFFIPEESSTIQQHPRKSIIGLHKCDPNNLTNNLDNYVEGITALSSCSNQEFRKVRSITLDYDRETFFNIRLIGKIPKKVKFDCQEEIIDICPYQTENENIEINEDNSGCSCKVNSTYSKTENSCQCCTPKISCQCHCCCCQYRKNNPCDLNSLRKHRCTY